jgi:hypothetical protein
VWHERQVIAEFKNLFRHALRQSSMEPNKTHIGHTVYAILGIKSHKYIEKINIFDVIETDIGEIIVEYSPAQSDFFDKTRYEFAKNIDVIKISNKFPKE